MDGDSGAPTGVILAVIGGVVMVVAAILTWLTVALDVDAFAKALGVDPAALAGAVGQTSKKFAGTTGSEGKVALACGVVALVVGLIAFSRRELSKTLGKVAIIAGGVGLLMGVKVVIDKGNVIGDAKAAAASTFTSAGLDPSILDSVFKVTVGIGLWLCILGGVLAVLGGLMLLKNQAAMPAMTGMSGGGVPPPLSDSGFGTSTVAGSMAAPASPPPPPLEPPTMSEPAPPPAADPPATDSTGGDAGSGTPTP